jgi:asparagine synthase (glutamine-hydrolysing)
MCGINGILRLRDDAAAVVPEELRRTRDSMVSRGPDGCGEWLAPDGRVGLGHRRLAIIDLSDAGAQPMSRDGRYWIVFNGEIYNYRELRAELSSRHAFRSHSDTETILALFSEEGLKGLARLRGMFALAIWDEQEKTLLLARDPNGIKPLYYASDGKHLRFASQVKALVAGGEVSPRVDSAGVCGFLIWGAVPEPWTIYETVKALPAGHLLLAGPRGIGGPEALAPSSVPAQSTDMAIAIEESVAAHLVADVPVAIFLSAGLDSTVIAAIARRHLRDAPVTVTLRFREFAGTPDDEGPLAAEVARDLGTRHVERWIDRDEFIAGWDESVRAMDQPSIDGFNTFWVCKAAFEAGVKVALSGLGGDELLGGYPSFHDVPAWHRWGRVAARVPGLQRMWPAFARLRARQPKLRGFVRYASTLEGCYLLRRGLFLPEELPEILEPSVARRGLEAYEPVSAISNLTPPCRSDWESVHHLESTLYMRNQLLRDADWASMAHSVEVRVPFVDAWLQQSARTSAFALPRREGKAGIVRRLAAELPVAIFDRPKTGFRLPTTSWLADGVGRQGSRGLAQRALAAFGIELRP